MKLPRIIFYFFFTIYCFFPNEIKDFGIGDAGARVLFLDIFCILIVLSTIVFFPVTTKNLLKVISKWGFIIFIVAVILSLARGLPDYGGIAIGEGRWFLSALLILPAFIFFDDKTIHFTRKIIYAAAVFQTLIIFMNYAFFPPANPTDDAVRFGSGRQSFIIYLACMFIIIEFILHGMEGRIKMIFLLASFSFAILIAQTRTIFLLLPAMSLVIILLSRRIRFRYLFKLASYLALIIAGLLLVMHLLIRPKITNSIIASVQVASEIFQASTYAIILDPTLIDFYADDFSLFGNNLWRAYAWGQTFQDINDAEFGWFIGLPMGSGYEFYDPSGELLRGLEPHNDYISIISKIGLIGLFGYILILYNFFTNYFTIRKYLEWNSEQLNNWLTLFVIVLSLLLFSFTNDEIRTYGTYFWIWIFLGFGFRFIYDILFFEIEEFK